MTAPELTSLCSLSLCDFTKTQGFQNELSSWSLSILPSFSPELVRQPTLLIFSFEHTLDLEFLILCNLKSSVKHSNFVLGITVD